MGWAGGSGYQFDSGSTHHTARVSHGITTAKLGLLPRNGPMSCHLTQGRTFRGEMSHWEPIFLGTPPSFAKQPILRVFCAPSRN